MKKHIWPLVALIALTLLVEAPWIALPFYAGDAYRGINIAPIGNDELFYLSRANAVLQGHTLGQPFISGNENVADSFFSDVEYVYMVPLRVLGLAPYVDVPTLYNILNTIGVFALLLLIYALVYFLSRDVYLAAAAAVFAIGGYYWIEYGTVFNMLLKGHSIFQSSPNIFGRSTDPYSALVPFFGFLICTYGALMQEHVRPAGLSTSSLGARSLPRPSFKNAWAFRYVIGAGVLFGILFYDYFYAWTFALAFLGSLTLTALAWRKWHASVTVIAIGCIGVVLGAYQMYGLFSLYTSAMGQQITYFLQTSQGHMFITSTTGMATLILFALYWYLRRDDKNNFFILALIMAGWVALEQQVLTGRVVEYGHYYWYFVVPLSIMVATYMGIQIMKMYSGTLARWACIALIAGAFINTIGGQYRAFFASLPDTMRQQDFAPILQKLNELPDGVVLGDMGGSSTSLLLTVYTRDTNYFSFAGTVNIFPIERLRQALLVYLYLNKESRSDPVAYLKRELSTSNSSNYTAMYEYNEGYFSGLHSMMYRSPVPRTDPRILAARETFLPEIGKEYKEFVRSPRAVRAMLESRGVRYIIWDKRQYPEWDLSVLGPLNVLATSTDVILYSLAQ